MSRDIDEMAVLQQNVGWLEDIVFDAKNLLAAAKDTTLHGQILGIQAVAENSANSLRAAIKRIDPYWPHAGGCSCSLCVHAHSLC